MKYEQNHIFLEKQLHVHVLVSEQRTGRVFFRVKISDGMNDGSSLVRRNRRQESRIGGVQT